MYEQRVDYLSEMKTLDQAKYCQGYGKDGDVMDLSPFITVHGSAADQVGQILRQ